MPDMLESILRVAMTVFIVDPLVHGGERVDGAAVARPHERRVRLGEGGLEGRDGGRAVALPAAALQHVDVATPS